MTNIRIVSRKQMSGENIASYCPFCAKEVQKDGKRPEEELRPLFVITTAEYVKERDREFYDHHYECPNCCRSNITTEDFIKAYCKMPFRTVQELQEQKK